MSNSFANIPAELRALRQWVVWRYEPGEKKPRKVPYYVNDHKRHGTQGSPEDRAALGTFEQAVKLAKSKKFNGIGLAMLPESGFIGVDLDHCVKDGEYSAIAKEFLTDDTYAERSPSDEGVRLFYHGTGIDKKNHEAGVESFYAKGFLTITGNRINGTDILAMRPERQTRLNELTGAGPKPALNTPQRRITGDVKGLVERLRSALEFLKAEADDRELWLKFGWAIGRDTGQSREGFDLWMEWAQQSSEHDAAVDPKAMAEEYFVGSLKPHDNPVTVASIFKLARDKGWRLRRACTELGNAERLADAAEERLRFCPQVGKWLSWDGGRWIFDEDGVALRVAKAVARGIYAEAQAETDDARRAALGKWAAASESAGRLRAAVELARSDARLLVGVSELDTDPWLLGVRNGTLDLRTGALLPATPEQYITKQALVAFDPEARCALWEKFLDRIFAGDAELIRYVQRAIGYSLTGDTMAKTLFFMYGPRGDNGKSTLIETLLALLGDYALKTRSETLMRGRDGNDNSATPDRVALRGARLVVAAELSDRQQFDETFLKDATGGIDRITARNLYESSITFRPEFKLWLYGNHKPRLREDDDAAWRRMHLIPFEERIPFEEQDTGLGCKLIQELPGILNWAMVGLAEWGRMKLAPPGKVLAAVTAYHTEMDSIGRFLEERCELKAEARAGDLYRAYKGWTEENGERPLGNPRFSQKLNERGFQSRTVHGLRIWVDVSLRQGDTQ